MFSSISICNLNASSDVCRVFEGHVDEINAICWSPGGHYLASCSDDTTAKVWVFDDADVSGDKTNSKSGLLLNLLGHSKEIYTTRWTPTGEGSPNPSKELFLCTASFDGTVKVWRVTGSGSVVFSLCNSATFQPVYSVSASPSGDYLAIGSQGGFVSLWDMSTGSLV